MTHVDQFVLETKIGESSENQKIIFCSNLCKLIKQNDLILDLTPENRF